MDAPSAKGRIDQWLWHARLFKTRSLATHMVRKGKVCVDGQKTTKASLLITVGQILTFRKDDRERVIIVRAIGKRRGPALEAQLLYEDHSPEPIKKAGTPSNASGPYRPRGSGRPTKVERRRTDRLLGKD